MNLYLNLALVPELLSWVKCGPSLLRAACANERNGFNHLSAEGLRTDF